VFVLKLLINILLNILGGWIWVIMMNIFMCSD